MKILYKPKFRPIICTRCDCVFKPKKKDLRCDYTDQLYFNCPVCGERAYDNMEQTRLFIKRGDLY